MIRLVEISEENVIPICMLEVAEDQKDQVAPNSFSIAEGSYAERAWMRGIYDDEKPVGFVMLALEPEKDEYYLWRYMIDQRYQGKGYGKAGMALIIQFLKTMPEVEELITSYVPNGERGANHFYESIGFIDTGEVDEGEIIMRYSLK